jgi:hypothetical protein
MWLEASAEHLAMHSLTSTVSVQRPLGRNDQTAHWPPDRKSQGWVVCNSARTIWTSAVCVNASLHICTNYYRLCLSSTPRRSSKSLASACPGHHTSRTSKIEQTPAASLISGDLICIPRLSLNTGTVLWYPSSVDKITVQSIVALPWSGQLNRCEVWCIVQIPFAYGSFSRRWLRGGWHVNVFQYM